MSIKSKNISIIKRNFKGRQKNRNRVDFGLEDIICILLQMYHIKREAWFGGAKLNVANCRRLMDKNEDIISSIRYIFIEMNKGTISENNIKMYCKEHT